MSNLKVSLLLTCIKSVVENSKGYIIGYINIFLDLLVDTGGYSSFFTGIFDG